MLTLQLIFSTLYIVNVYNSTVHDNIAKPDQFKKYPETAEPVIYRHRDIGRCQNARCGRRQFPRKSVR